MKNAMAFKQLCRGSAWILPVICILFPGITFGQFGPRGVCRAMVIGISEYQDPEIPDLRFAHRDAQAFAIYLQIRPVDKVKPENLKLLINDQATGGNVHLAIRSIVQESQSGDKVVIYFAGHGDVETLYPDEPGHLLVFDTPANNYSANSLRLDDIRRSVNALVSRNIQVLIVTDACHAGKLAGSAVNGAQAATSSMAEQFNSEIKILSCQSNEFSQEGEQWGEGRGVFSWYLIQGLMGMADVDRDLQVTIKELSRFLEDMIEPDVAPQRQTPNLVGDRNARIAVIDEAQLLAFRKELDPNFSTSNPVLASREPDVPPVERIDSVWVKKRSSIQWALDNKRLIREDMGSDDPGRISAYDQLQQLKKDYPEKNEVKQIEDQLIAKLQEGAQQAVNAYLKNDQQELINRWKGSSASYQRFPAYLKTAASMLDSDQYLRNRLLALAHYFQAINYRFSAEKETRTRSSFLHQALAQADSAKLFEPRSAYIPNEIGLIYSRLDMEGKAIQYYQEALDIAPTWAMPYNNLAMNAYEENLNQAAEWASMALQRDSSLFGSYFVRALFHKENNEQFLAETALLEGIRRNPNIPQPMMNFASYWIQVERPEMAEMWYQQVLTKSPIATNHLHDIGNYYSNKSDFDRSIYYFQQVIKADPTFTEAWFEMGNAFMHKGNLKDAKNAFQETLKLQNNHPGALSNLGHIAFREGEPQMSLTYYKQAMNAIPGTTYCPAIEGAAAVQLQLGSLSESKKLITQFLNECADIPSFHESRKSVFYNLACIESREGRLEDAFIALEKALDAGFGNENHIRTDPDLQSLHDKPEWEQILKKYFNN